MIQGNPFSTLMCLNLICKSIYINCFHHLKLFKYQAHQWKDLVYGNVMIYYLRYDYEIEHTFRYYQPSLFNINVPQFCMQMYK